MTRRTLRSNAHKGISHMGMAVHFHGLDKHGNDVQIGAIVWDGAKLSVVGDHSLNNLLRRPVVVSERGKTKSVTASQNPEAFLRGLHSQYRSAYLRASDVQQYQAGEAPQRYEATAPGPTESVDPESDSSLVYLAAYRGEQQSPVFVALGFPEEVRRFLAWCRSQDATPEVQQFAIDKSTNPHGAHGDVQVFAKQLSAALSTIIVDPHSEDENDIGHVIHRIGETVLGMIDADVQGVVVTGEDGGEREDVPEEGVR